MRKKDQIKEKFDNKLLVEGADDQHVVWAICQRFRITETFDVVDLEGIGNLMEDVSVRPKQADISRLGIIVDADINVAHRWNQLRTRLDKFGYLLPDEPDLAGNIVAAEDLPQVGIWLMPDNQSPGILEDFMRQLIVSGDERLSFAEETLQELEKRGIQRYKKVHRTKALMHTWIAWQDKPGTPLGQSTTRYLDTDTQLCQRFAAWLNRLFNEA